MDPDHIQKVKEEHQKGLACSLQNIRKWAKFKDDYKALKQRLETLADKVAYEVMVPFGPHAFMPGRLVHTNNITVLLGEDWFAEISAKQAVQIAERRIKHCDKMLQEYEKEKKQFENWLGYISEVSSEGELVEIIEEYDPEKEKLWREQHAKNVQAYHRKLAKEKSQSATEKDTLPTEHNDNESSDSKVDEHYFKSKLKASEPRERGDSVSSEDTVVTNSEESPGKIDDSEESVTEKHEETSEDSVEDSSNEESESDETENEQHHDYTKHVRWKDESQSDSKCITFTHSKPKKKKNNISKSIKTKHSDKLSPTIQSPSDVYKCFVFPPQQSKPKSILKNVKLPVISESENSYVTLNKVKVDNSKLINTSVQIKSDISDDKSAFTGVVKERIEEVTDINDDKNPWKPVSRFKSSRKVSKS